MLLVYRNKRLSITLECFFKKNYEGNFHVTDVSLAQNQYNLVMVLHTYCIIPLISVFLSCTLSLSLPSWSLRLHLCLCQPCSYCLRSLVHSIFLSLPAYRTHEISSCLDSLPLFSPLLSFPQLSLQLRCSKKQPSLISPRFLSSHIKSSSRHQRL